MNHHAADSGCAVCLVADGEAFVTEEENNRSGNRAD